MEAVIIGVGCRRCEQLARMAQEILDELGADHIHLRTVRNSDGIADVGPVLTPALILGNAILVSGRVPSRRYLRRLIREQVGPCTSGGLGPAQES